MPCRSGQVCVCVCVCGQRATTSIYTELTSLGVAGIHEELHVLLWFLVHSFLDFATLLSSSLHRFRVHMCGVCDFRFTG